jgi:hypothetical protein
MWFISAGYFDTLPRRIVYPLFEPLPASAFLAQSSTAVMTSVAVRPHNQR